MDGIEDIYELSPMQQGMLFHTLYAPKSGFYVVQLHCTLRGDLDSAAFKHAWQRVLERHAVLRTSFHWEDLDKPLQVVHTHAELPWEQHNWRDLGSAEQQELLETFLRSDRERGFPLDRAPQMRCALMQVAQDTYQFVWSFHHVLTDGWCASLILKEVSAFYESLQRGQALHLDAPRPYRDYIAWLQQQDLAHAEVFWRRALRRFTAATPLVIDRPVGSRSDKQETYDEWSLGLWLDSII